MTIQLSLQLAELLGEIIRKRCPGAIGMMGSLPEVRLTKDQTEEVRQAVTDELIETGLADDDAPNERGLLIEELIDRLGHPWVTTES